MARGKAATRKGAARGVGGWPRAARCEGGRRRVPDRWIRSKSQRCLRRKSGHARSQAWAARHRRMRMTT